MSALRCNCWRWLVHQVASGSWRPSPPAAAISRHVSPTVDFVGHIGGDDFIVLSTPEKMEALAQLICDAFDAVAPSFYSEEDRARGAIIAKDRQGNTKEFPLLSVAIGICHNRDRKLTGFAQVAHLGAELKKVAKGKPGSAFVVDRRKD